MKLSPAGGTGRLAFGAIAALCCTVALAGCTAPSVERTHSGPPSPTPTVSPVFSDPRDRIGESCAVLATVETELDNAYMDRAKGKLSDAQYAAIVNTAPTSLKALSMIVSHGLESQVGGLLEDTAITPPVVPGATFDPNGQPFQGDLRQAVAACNQNGTPMGVLVPGSG